VDEAARPLAGDRRLEKGEPPAHLTPWRSCRLSRRRTAARRTARGRAGSRGC
jgi:hypothetical protein